MNTLKTIENLGRQAWLAGLGAYGTGWDFAIEKFDSSFEKGNKLINELISTGEKVEDKLQSKFDNKIPTMDFFENRLTEVKNKLGLNKVPQMDRVEELTAKVDNLTAAVNQLVANKKVKKTPAKASAKARATVKKVATKVSNKVAASAKDTIKKITK